MKILVFLKNPAPYIEPILEYVNNVEEIVVAYCLPDDQEGIHYCKGAYSPVFLNRLVKTGEKSELGIINSGISRLFEEHNFDAVLIGTSYWSLSTWGVIKNARKRHIPMVTRATVEADRKRNLFLRLVKKVIVGRYCELMGAGLYEGLAQKSYLIHYGMRPETLFYSPCAVDNGFFAEQSEKYKKNSLRTNLIIGEDEFVICSVSMLIPRKRPMDIVKAFELLQNEGYKVKLFFVGDGELKTDIHQYTQIKGIHGITITGMIEQSDVCKYLAVSDAFVLASKNDASPKALNEAMNFSLPIVVSKGVNTAKELLLEGKNGFVFEPGDVNALYDCLKKLILDRTTAKQMGMVSREIVEKSSVADAAKAWVEALHYAYNGIK